ncbi:Ribbon-helix-helix protein, copG family [Candidatus Methylomirabilis lanthanidiphila]|uniref:Ribbon-helix-helix protein, copG family n=1 Tax=Candidatus Methylomirabilis lanthanidiphila TaxID=2211376 RepID=A0A564ZJQ4_9BACT|nr:ribbon-helix-helix protein, CopG family [Candidatus Methylomirabilis lanthanidiphila]VUZ85571.1 Ribbon-helix-helix protein, copG family [Candidatus Methylomirabilis lanthanidiphila]
MGARISVRLQEPLLKQLNREARKRRIRRSDLVREALEAFLSGEVARVDSLPYERVRDLVGSLAGGPPDLGEQHRKYLWDLIGERR